MTFNPRRIVVVAAIFCTAFVAANTVLGLLSAHGVPFHYTPFWPVNVFDEPDKSLLYRLVVGAGVFAAFIVINRLLARRSYPLGLTILAGFLLIVGSNLIQGWDAGFYRPIAEDEYRDEPAPQYYHDAIKITDAADFFRRHNELQPTLLMHARTHPPGPVLLVFALWRLVRDPALIALAIAVIAVPLSASFLHRILSIEVQPATAGYATFLFLLLPAVQIYYLATVDAVIAGLLLGVSYCFVRAGATHLVFCVALLAVALLFTLVSLVIVPVLIGCELLHRRSIVRCAIVLCATAIVFVAVDVATGYNVVQTFRTASAIENPGGFSGLHAPIDYVVTRIEDVAELILFLGPFLTIVLWRAARLSVSSRLSTSATLAAASLALLFLSGAFRVGETARACAFIYAFLLLPIAVYLQRNENANGARTQLATLVFAQTIVMQIAGNYFW